MIILIKIIVHKYLVMLVFFHISSYALQNNPAFTAMAFTIYKMCASHYNIRPSDRTLNGGPVKRRVTTFAR